MKLLTQVYTATVRPHMEYASSAWSSAAKINLDQLTKTQNAGLRIITGGMKTTPISDLERTTGLLSLGERREEKTPAPKRKNEEASFPPITLQVRSSHQKQTQETESKSSGQSASAETQDLLISTQPTTGNASKL